MLNHQFKRVLMVPHYDAAGEEVIVEGEYILEWMIRNRASDPGMELWVENEDLDIMPTGWRLSAGTIIPDTNNERSGTYCAKMSTVAQMYSSVTEFVVDTGMDLKFSVWAKSSGTAARMTVGIYFFNAAGALITGYGDTEVYDLTTSYQNCFVIIHRSDIPANTATIRVTVASSASGPGGDTVYVDDVALCLYNPHHITDYDDFAALNVEDLETFTFGQNYNYESGGQPLADASRLSEDTVQYLRMANSRAERVKIRDPIDIYRMRFMLYSKAQQTQLMHWYKRTRGLPFIWVDECGIERDVQWVQAPDIMPRSNNPEIATVQIVLETIDAGEV